jgi:hypothetical protein
VSVGVTERFLPYRPTKTLGHRNAEQIHERIGGIGE